MAIGPLDYPSFSRTYLSAACNVTITYDECAVDCTTLGTNILNLTSEPKPQI